MSTATVARPAATSTARVRRSAHLPLRTLVVRGVVGMALALYAAIIGKP